MKAMRVLLALCLAAAGVLASLTLAHAAPPVYHENPNSAQWVYDGTSYLQKLSQVLTYVIESDAESIKPVLEEASRANIPPDLSSQTDDFYTSSESLAKLLPAVVAGMDSASSLLAESRPSDAAQTANEALGTLYDAYTQLRVLDTSVAGAGRWWRLPTVAPQTPLYAAYNDVLGKLAHLRDMLDGMEQRIEAVVQQSEKLSSAADQETISPTTLSLSVSPRSAFVGDRVTFDGVLSSSKGALGGRSVTLTVDGASVQVLRTDAAGAFGGSFTLPYRYDSSVAQMQAIYFPTGEDLGAYLGSSSEQVSVNVLFYPVSIEIKAPGRAYPGKTLDLEGKLDYGGAPALASRNVIVLWDNDVVAEETVSGAFSVVIPVRDSEQTAAHRLSVYASANGRYAPAQASASVDVVRAAPVIDAHAQGLLLLPASLKVTGSVSSDLGPPANSLVSISMGDWKTTTLTRDDGSFEARLGTGMSLAFIGWQQVSVQVAPEEPWYQQSSTNLGLTVINPVNIVFLALALLALAVVGARSRIRGGLRPVTESVAEPVVMAERSEPVAKQVGKALGPRGLVLALYREVLIMVQGFTAVALGPNRTLREFAQECAPRLGPLSRYFREFTLLAERLLYSRQGAEEKDVARGKELGDRLKEGLKGENA